MDKPVRIATSARTGQGAVRVPSLEVLIEVMSGLESDGGDAARILRRVMTHVVEALCAEAAVVVRQAPDGSFDHLRAIGSLDDPEVAEQILAYLPRPLPAGCMSIQGQGRDADGQGSDADGWALRGDLLVFPLDIYHLVALVPGPERLPADALPLVELITRHAAQALENARLREELARSESLSEVGKAVKRVLHDLRNPIGRIHVAVDRANVPGCDAETVGRMHAIITSSAEDVLNIANDVSDFTSSTRITKIRITAESLLAALTDSCMNLPITLRCVNEHKGTVHCDPQKLLRALTRMVESLCGATDPEAGPESRIIEIQASLDDSDTVMTIRGHGFAIPADVRARVFEPFAMHSRTGSKGLGLAIVRSIIRAHGGDIVFAGDDHEASSFVMRLPREASR